MNYATYQKKIDLKNNILISVKDLQIKAYSDAGDHIILDKINLEIKKGEKLGLIGETGSGKSMLGHSLINMIPSGCSITSGTVNNYINSTIKRSTLRGYKISMISQDPMHSLNPLQNIEKQFSTFLMKRFGFNKPKAREHILNWINKVQLQNVQDILKRYPHQLSGGQMQRIMIAIALSIEPELIIADEITTGLDANVKMEILNLLFYLQKHHRIAVLLISHDVMSIQKYCDRIAVLQSGRIIQTGATNTIMTKPRNDYVKALTKTRIKLEAEKSDFHTDSSIKKIIKIKNLYKTYYSGGVTVSALSNVSFELYEKETLGIIGESGSGKTTLVKTMLNILKPDSGEIDFVKEENVNNSANLIRAVGSVFQDNQGSLNPKMNIYDILSEPLVIKGITRYSTIKEKVITILEKVHLSEKLLSKFPYQLSGGQRQRVSIGRSLMVDPYLLILDEPTSALDISTQNKILTLLSEIKKQTRISFVFISHDLAVVSEMSDRLAVLYKGDIVEYGKTNDVLNNPSNDYTKKLIDSNVWMSKKTYT